MFQCKNDVEMEFPQRNRSTTVHPDTGISSKAVKITNSTPKMFFERIDGEPSPCAQYNNRPMIAACVTDPKRPSLGPHLFDVDAVM
ncbi:unnamed protein product [Bursaphelenchus xylophilus]|uniref:(pine wood nematode) hypothetical protein n=1 Tax=Bursaphelenchus xylophilus TaxID=6326 RepID=A0A1I7SIC7_BURXY|nr:unnamed protein product [Bursaphelenchus xylophilus]CAG9106083.1 unnamed protein product [Bursaphelenchus xylophilus]